MIDNILNIWNRRLPQGIGIIVLVFSLGTIFWLSRNAILFGTKAAVGNIPKDVQISNISDKSFTVSYITDDTVTGSVSYGTDAKLGRVAFDKRDAKAPLLHTIHYITISGLLPSTKYSFSILSGDKTFDNSGSMYTVTTSSTQQDAQSAKSPLSGLVTLEGGSMPNEAIAYVETDKSQLLSELVMPNGTYSIPLTNLLKKDLTGFIDIAPTAILKLRIVNQTLASNISLLASQSNPVPPVILSKDYDFSISTLPLAASSASNSAGVTGFPSVDSTTESPSIQILTPTASEEFKDQQPSFSGKALPGKDVEISLQSDPEASATIQADTDGNWEYRPETKLKPGKDTLTIKTPDSQGTIKTLTRSFTVFAEGSQFVEPSISPVSSPSPTIPPTATPTPTPAPTITQAVTPAISPTDTPAPTPTTEPTITPTPVIVIVTPVTQPSGTPIPNITTPPIPDSGSSAFFFGLAGLSIFIGIGSLLFFLL